VLFQYGADKRNTFASITLYFTMKPRIVSNPNILLGKPVVEGTRLSVELILEKLSDSWSYADLLDAYPRLTIEGIEAALEYAAAVMRNDEEYPIISMAA